MQNLWYVGMPIIKYKTHDHIIFKMRILVPEKSSLYIETGPEMWKNSHQVLFPGM